MKKTFIILAIVLLGFAGVFILGKNKSENNIVDLNPIVVPKEDDKEIVFTEVKIITNNPKDELTKLVGDENLPIVLRINRIDIHNIKKGMTVFIPDSFDNKSLTEFMPGKIKNAENIKKLIVVYQRTQSIGFYENGVLVRSGPVSSGRKDNPTPSGIYFTNWKGKLVNSTVDGSWIMKWNFNIDNENGIGIHQYALPGYPASHSCIRMFEDDAIWMYDWADQWILNKNGSTKLANGTPVVVYGPYDFESIAPWKDLVNNPNALDVSTEELEQVVNLYLPTIEREQAYREKIISGVE